MAIEMADLITTEAYPRNGMGKKIMTAALAVLLFTAVITAVASATTIWVPEGGNQTIQQAVNNATDGDTIIVRDGTYRENVDVNTAYLTIRSENGSANCIVNASDSGDHVFGVTADYVNISGFTVTNATGSGRSGIYLLSRQHCNISDNNVSGNYYGICLSSSGYNTLTNNTASSNSHYGIRLTSCNYNTLTSNTLTNNMLGIWTHSSSNNTLTNNTANSNTQYGIGLFSLSSNNTLTSNTANSNHYGIYLYSSSNYNTLTNNTANSNSHYGIYLRSLSDNTLTNNTANSNDDTGIYLWSASNNNVSCNWVQNNSDRGFYLEGGSTGNTIENNNIIENGVYNASTDGYEYQFYNDQSDNVETKHNFWGYGMNDTIINASIYDWQDNHDYGNVTFDNRNGPAPCAPIPELPTILLFGIGLVALAGYIRIGRKKDE